MSPLNFTYILTQAVDELSESESHKGLFHQHTDGNPLPSAKALCDIIELHAHYLPGYFGNSTVNSRTVTYHIQVNVERLFDLLTEQILAGLCFGSDDECSCCTELQREEAASIAARFISHLPELRRILATDVEAAYNGDPAAFVWRGYQLLSGHTRYQQLPHSTRTVGTRRALSFRVSSPKWPIAKPVSIFIRELP